MVQRDLEQEKRDFADEFSIALSRLSIFAKAADEGKYSKGEEEQVRYAVSAYGTSFSGMAKHLSDFQLDKIAQCAAKELDERKSKKQDESMQSSGL